MPSAHELGVSKPLSVEGKAAAREALLHCLIKQVTPVEIRDTKESLQARYACSRQAIDGVHAQITKEIDYAVGEEAHSPRLVAALLTAASRLEDASGGPYGAIVLEHLAASCEIATPVFQRMFERFQEMARYRLHSNSSHSSAESVDNGTGATVSYDNPTKRRWRACIEWELSQYLRSFSQSQIAGLKVLCLPSRNPHPEL